MIKRRGKVEIQLLTSYTNQSAKNCYSRYLRKLVGALEGLDDGEGVTGASVTGETDGEREGDLVAVMCQRRRRVLAQMMDIYHTPHSKRSFYLRETLGEGVIGDAVG